MWYLAFQQVQQVVPVHYEAICDVLRLDLSVFHIMQWYFVFT